MAARPTHPALIDVTSAAAALVARWARADEAAIRPHRAAGTMGTRAAQTGVRQGAVWAWKNRERVSLGLITPLLAWGSTPECPLSPRKPRGHRQENRAVPATTELWQTPRPAQGPEWQGSSSWHRSPTQPGGHLWQRQRVGGTTGQGGPRDKDTFRTGKTYQQAHSTHSYSLLSFFFSTRN